MGVRFDMHDDGVLWFINEVVFHRMGFAIGHTPGTDEWEIYGDGTERWRWAEEVPTDELKAKINTLLSRARKENEN